VTDSHTLCRGVQGEGLEPAVIERVSAVCVAVGDNIGEQNASELVHNAVTASS